MTIEQAELQGYEAIAFGYQPGFAEADPMFELTICGRHVSCGETPLDALKALLERLDKAERLLSEVRKVVREPSHQCYPRHLCGDPASP